MKLRNVGSKLRTHVLRVWFVYTSFYIKLMGSYFLASEYSRLSSLRETYQVARSGDT